MFDNNEQARRFHGRLSEKGYGLKCMWSAKTSPNSRYEDVAAIIGPKTDEAHALERADRLINWMSEYIGQMAPGKYADCYKELNEHGIYMERLRKGT